MNRTSFFRQIAVESIEINGEPAANLSEAIVAVSHAADHTTPVGTSVQVSLGAIKAWYALPEDDRRELWDLACAGKLDHAAEPDPGNVVAIRPIQYRMVHGEIGNEQGHITHFVPGTTEESAKMALSVALEDGTRWGRIEWTSADREGWERI